MAPTSAYVAVLALMCLAPGAATAAATTEPTRPDPIELGGSPVEVSSDAAAPTELEAGLWADTLTGPGGPDANAHLFRYDRTMEYSAVLVGVVATSTEEYADTIAVTMTAPDGSPCDTESAASGLRTSEAVFGVSATASAEPGERDDPCVAADHVLIRVDRGSSDATTDLPFTIRVVEEAPVNGTVDDLPPLVEDPPGSLPEPVPAEPVTGGGFDDAPDLTSGVTVADRVPEGTERLYRVRLDWGQALSVRVDVPAQDADAIATLGDFAVGPTVGLTLIDPLRNPFDGGADTADVSGPYDEAGATLFDATRPVAYLNRFDDGLMSTPGDYWVSVSVQPPGPDRRALDVPVEITAEVVGEPGGAPPFRDNVLGPGGGSAPEGYDPSTPYLVEAGVFGADVSGTPTRRDRATGSQDEGDGTRRTLGLALGAASALSCAAGLLLLRRRGVSPGATTR